MLAEPRVAGAPRRVWRDWVLVGIAVPLAIAEALLRPDLPWRWPTLALALVLLPTLLWRRSHPLATALATIGSMFALSVADIVAGFDEPAGLHTMAVLVVTLYAVVRWGSGRDALSGVGVALATSPVAIVADYTGVSDTIGGFAVLAVIVAIAAAVRFRGRARQRELEQVRLHEREELARDLHDTVAHHVSAIAIRAQAGIAVSETRPEAAVEALRVIETEASRTLSEMRAMVGVLRRDEPASLAPAPTLADLASLARRGRDGPAVDVAVEAGLSDVAPQVATTLYRIAQESVTNARRHARQATRVTVTVSGDGDDVRLQVTDDGTPVGARGERGYGIVGIVERAHLLGGTAQAGPGPRRGWVVTAVVPRRGVPA